MGELKTVYFAGKVSKGGGYRGILFNDPMVMSYGYKKYKVNGGEVIYGGPFAIGNADGFFHRNGTHGLYDENNGYCSHSAYGIVGGFEGWPSKWNNHLPFESGIIEKEFVVNRCLDQIRDCDAVHCFIDSLDCYGTLFELGYANAIAKPTYIFYNDKKNWDKHYWFILNGPSVKFHSIGTPDSIHPNLVSPQKTYKERYQEYLQSFEWIKKRIAKIREAGGRCQLCNSSGTLNVHHRTYDRVFNELQSDLIVLCEVCHSKYHEKLPVVG